MGLRTKFNLVLLCAITVGLAIAGVFSHKMLKNNAREEVLETARIMMESAIAVRGYTVKEIRPLLQEQQKSSFVSQTVPAYAASQYIKRLQVEHPDYSYKEATLNPTNPANRATEWETDVVSHFRNYSAADELVGVRETPTGPQLFLGRPIQIKDGACLACHGLPSEAPATLISAYGDNNGFGWKLNEVVGAQIVSVPMSLPLERAQHAFVIYMIALISVFILVIILLNIMLHYIVLKPVCALSKRADEISMGNLNMEELEFTGNDEIASLGKSFNRMHRSLDNAVKLLDETMDD